MSDIHQRTFHLGSRVTVVGQVGANGPGRRLWRRFNTLGSLL